MVYSQHIEAATSSSVMPEIGIAPLVVTADRRVPISKYSSIVTTSAEIAKKFCVSNKDKTFESLDMLDKALRASNLLSLVDGARKRPTKAADNTSGYVADVIVDTVNADGMPSYIVIASDDCYKYYDETIIAFTFMMSMIHKDMHHMQLEGGSSQDLSSNPRTFQRWQESPCGSSSKEVECPQARARHRKRPTGADLGSGSSAKEGDARVPKVWSIESPDGT